MATRNTSNEDLNRYIVLENNSSDFDDDEVQVYQVCFESNEKEIRNVEDVSDRESKKEDHSQILESKSCSLFHGKWILYSSANYETRKGYDEIIGTMMVDELLIIGENSDGSYKFINGLSQLFPPTKESKLIFQNLLSSHTGKTSISYLSKEKKVVQHMKFRNFEDLLIEYSFNEYGNLLVKIASNKEVIATRRYIPLVHISIQDLPPTSKENEGNGNT